MPSITILYAGLLGLINFGLALQCGLARGKTGVNFGDGGNDDMTIAMRSHSNFTEFVPLTLIIIGFLELNGVASNAIHGLAGGLVAARIFHAVGFTAAHPGHVMRTIGAAGTTLVLVVSSIWAITTAL